MKKVLVTGGAGFIGSYIVDSLIENGDDVIIYDNLDPQVHPNGDKPDYLNKDARFILGDIRDYDAFAKAVENVEQIYHMAAAVGVGQSMYEISRYVEVNTLGTANLLDILTNRKNKVEKMLVAGSMSSYGEGRYRCPRHGVIDPPLRTEEQMAAGKWELICDSSDDILEPVLTDESKPLDCNSIYATTKKDQEEMTLMWGKAYDIPTTALRFFNVYGPRQSLSNPYTGVCAIFLSRLLNGKPPVIYEDGLQTRDFISVRDIAKACRTAMNDDRANHNVYNVGNGIPLSINKIAETLASILGLDVKPEITRQFRKGDVRHCIADISRIRTELDFNPEISFMDGMIELIEWTKSTQSADGYQTASSELEKRGLLVKQSN